MHKVRHKVGQERAGKETRNVIVPTHIHHPFVGRNNRFEATDVNFRTLSYASRALDARNLQIHMAPTERSNWEITALRISSNSSNLVHHYLPGNPRTII